MLFFKPNCKNVSLFPLQELDKAWKMVDAAHVQEKKDKETIRALKEEVSNLVKMNEQQTGFSVDKDTGWETSLRGALTLLAEQSE